MRRIFLRLVQFGVGRADTRRQLAVARLIDAGDDTHLFEETLQALVRARLPTLSAGENEDATQRQVDISHEALISGWPKVQEWLKERREEEGSQLFAVGHEQVERGRRITIVTQEDKFAMQPGEGKSRV